MHSFLAFDMNQIENEASITAAKHVANMLQRPDQLEKVDKYMHRELRKKVMVITNLFFFIVIEF